MARYYTAQVERLGYLLNSGSMDQLKLALSEFEQSGVQKEKLINYPIQRYNGRTAVHLAASNGLFDCLELLLKSGGKRIEAFQEARYRQRSVIGVKGCKEGVNGCDVAPEPS